MREGGSVSIASCPAIKKPALEGLWLREGNPAAAAVAAANDNDDKN